MQTLKKFRYSPQPFEPSWLASGVRLAPAIERAAVVAAEKRTDDFYFVIQVVPACKSSRPCYIIARRYSEFIELNNQLAQLYKQHGRRDLLKLPTRFRTRYGERAVMESKAAAMNTFCDILFERPDPITRTSCVLEFFGCRKSDMEAQLPSKTLSGFLFLESSQRIARPTRSRHVTDRDTDHHNHHHHHLSALSLTSSVSTMSSSLSFFGCRTPSPPQSPTQDDRRLAKALPPLPISTPLPLPLPSPSAKRHPCPPKMPLNHFWSQASHLLTRPTAWMPWKNKTDPFTTASHKTRSPTTQESFLPPSHIKVKVIYDMDNIIVVQVPRTITLDAMRSRIHHKFSCPPVHLNTGFDLYYSDARGSASSLYLKPTQSCHRIDHPHEWESLLNSTCLCMEKITLRCVLH